MSLSEQRIPMTDEEAAGVDLLVAREGHERANVSLVRNDENESGPVRVEIDGVAWLVDEGGDYRKVGG
jgi:hypothetical protein